MIAASASTPHQRTARVIAVTSGKGGVGKTNVGVNLSVALARLGKQAMLVDGDVGLANANILLGLDPAATIADVIARDCRMSEVVQEGPGGMKLVPGHSGGGLGAGFTNLERERLARAFRPYADEMDFVLVDTASGISDDTLGFAAASDMTLLVLCSEPTAFMDAYQFVKVLALEHGCTDIAVVTNMVDGSAAGGQLFRHFADVVERFLPTRLSHLGSIPRDPQLLAAVLRKRCCLEAYPDSRASAAFGRIARVLAGRKLAPTRGGSRFFAMEALCGA